MEDNWFHSWFNSPYYHILYSERNYDEAERFIDNLAKYFSPSREARILDIACGKGRHSILLRKRGFDVTGIDLSENSINYAKRYEDEKLHFFVHDMRKLFYINYFDISLNLFTSFGYFETDKDNLNALKAFRKGLKAGGKLVIDYFNTKKILASLQPMSVKNMGGIDFRIEKQFRESKIIKDISFSDQGVEHHFQEKVRAFTLQEFELILGLAGLRIVRKFGNYELDDFEDESSDRVILVCEKL